MLMIIIIMIIFFIMIISQLLLFCAEGGPRPTCSLMLSPRRRRAQTLQKGNMINGSKMLSPGIAHLQNHAKDLNTSYKTNQRQHELLPKKILERDPNQSVDSFHYECHKASRLKAGHVTWPTQGHSNPRP